MLEVADEKGARDYESSIGAGAPEPEDYQGTELREDDRGLATAIVGDFLVIGSADGVRSVIDVSAGTEDAEPLSEDADGRWRPSASSPVTASPRRTCRPRGSTASWRSPTGRSRRSSRWSTRATPRAPRSRVGADESGLPSATRSVLDPERNPEAGGFFAAFEAVPARAAGRARARHAGLRRLRRRGRDRERPPRSRRRSGLPGSPPGSPTWSTASERTRGWIWRRSSFPP